MTATSLSPTSRAGSFLGTAFRLGAPWANACILAAVAAIVLAVSIPEIHAFVVRSNETDARTTLCKLERVDELTNPPLAQFEHALRDSGRILGSRPVIQRALDAYGGKCDVCMHGQLDRDPAGRPEVHSTESAHGQVDQCRRFAGEIDRRRGGGAGKHQQQDYSLRGHTAPLRAITEMLDLAGLAATVR